MSATVSSPRKNSFSSPVTPRGGELVSHRVKECCVHLHSCIQKWKELSSKGFGLANQIVNTTIQHKYTQDTSSYGANNMALSLTVTTRLESKVISERESLFLKLVENKDQLLKVVDKMGSIVSNLRSAVDLLLMKGHQPQQLLFTTLPPSMLGTYSEELYLAYSEELSLRESIVTDLLSQKDRDTLTVYLSCWLHEPHITSTVCEHLEAMLFECGLRT